MQLLTLNFCQIPIEKPVVEMTQRGILLRSINLQFENEQEVYFKKNS